MFTQGRELLAERFSVEAIRQRKVVRVREWWLGDASAVPFLRPDVRAAHPSFRVRRALRDATTEAESLREALDWAAQLPLSLGRAEAEAVCVLAAALYDDVRAPNPSFPPWLCGGAREAEWWPILRDLILPREMSRLRTVIQAAMARLGSWPIAGPRDLCEENQEVRAAHRRESETNTTKEARTDSYRPVPPSVAEDFATVVAGGVVFHFRTPKQREIVRHLYGAWKAAGCRDGCGMTLAGLKDALDATVERLRLERTFNGSEAIGRIIRRTNKGVWALFLNSPQASDAPNMPRESPR